jgi:hypothetical protein
MLTNTVPQAPWYFAHPRSDYGTEFERNIMTKLGEFGLILMSSDQAHHNVDHTLSICEGCIFLAFKSGFIGSSEALFAKQFLLRGLPVYEVTYQEDGSVELLSRQQIYEDRVLSFGESLSLVSVLMRYPNGGR